MGDYAFSILDESGKMIDVDFITVVDILSAYAMKRLYDDIRAGKCFTPDGLSSCFKLAGEFALEKEYLHGDMPDETVDLLFSNVRTAMRSFLQGIKYSIRVNGIDALIVSIDAWFKTEDGGDDDTTRH